MHGSQSVRHCTALSDASRRYSEDETRTWGVVYDKLAECHKQYACKARPTPARKGMSIGRRLCHAERCSVGQAPCSGGRTRQCQAVCTHSCALVCAKPARPKRSCCGTAALLQEFLAAMPELERHCGFARDNIPQVRPALAFRPPRLAFALPCTAVTCLALHGIASRCIASDRIASL